MSRGYLNEFGLDGLPWWQDLGVSSCMNWRPSGIYVVRKSGSRHLFAASARTRLLTLQYDGPS